MESAALDFANQAIESYQAFKRSSPFALHCEEFSLMTSIGDSLEGQAVLDLGCGWGCYTKALAQRHPAVLVATDQSADAVALAKAHNQGFNCIEYRVEDCAELPDRERFDLIVANFLLPFNASVERLRRTCANLYAALKPGGRALGFVPNGEPTVDFSRASVGRQVNCMYDVPDKREDGAEMHLVLFTQPAETRIPLRWYNRSTYQSALLDAGFLPEKIRFDPPSVSETGQKMYEPGFWDSIVHQPAVLLFHVVK